MIRLRSPEIYVGLFDIEKVGSSTITEPIGVSYRYPNSNIVDIAVAERGGFITNYIMLICMVFMTPTLDRLFNLIKSVLSPIRIYLRKDVQLKI